MAITKLMHMKESPGYKAKHLDAAIRYVLDVKNGGKKTDFGKWVGGNAGLTHESFLDACLKTKEFWDKSDGRQGYHFVISFSPGEADAQTAFNVLYDFCQEYLGDEYEHLFCVHTDQNHMHGHIVFNSVGRKDGVKYRYSKGDWSERIQPVTDKICKEYGLNSLVLEKEKEGISYAEWAIKKMKKINWTHVIRADVDYAIENSSNMNDFFAIMKKMHYNLDVGGNSKRYEGNYVTFIFTDDEGKEHRRRSFNLIKNKKGEDRYSLQAIEEKIKNKSLSSKFYKTLSDAFADKVANRFGKASIVVKGTKTYQRMYQAVSYYKLPNPFAVPAGEVRKDMLRIEQLIEECAYLKRNPSMTFSDMERKFISVDTRLQELYIIRKALKRMDEDVRTAISEADVNRYRQLHKLLNESEYGDAWETLEEALNELEKTLPLPFIVNDKRLRECETNIEALKAEKRILQRVLESEEKEDKKVSKNPEIIKGL